MKIVHAKVYVLKIPFNFSFTHSLKKRSCSDSIIIELTADTGVRGYGEGVARPYVTGETVAKSVKHIAQVLLPAIIRKNLPDIDTSLNPISALSFINDLLPDVNSPGIIAWNASRTAVELAVIDCLLKNRGKSLNSIVPAKTKQVTYSGVLSSSNLKQTIGLAKRFQQAGLKYIKMKIGKGNDLERISAVRDIVGVSVSIRLDANGAFNVNNAIKFIKSVEHYKIDSVEQPVKRGEAAEMAAVKADSPILIMADESIVTIDDAKRLMDCSACDYFNLRLSKCGGIFRTLAIADLCTQGGIKIQLGCQVGETAILSAAGRHIAAYLPAVRFVEGSYGALLLAGDISHEDITFGYAGKAPVLTGHGLGINIREDSLQKYIDKTVSIS